MKTLLLLCLTAAALCAADQPNSNTPTDENKRSRAIVEKVHKRHPGLKIEKISGAVIAWDDIMNIEDPRGLSVRMPGGRSQLIRFETLTESVQKAFLYDKKAAANFEATLTDVEGLIEAATQQVEAETDAEEGRDSAQRAADRTASADSDEGDKRMRTKIAKLEKDADREQAVADAETDLKLAIIDTLRQFVFRVTEVTKDGAFGHIRFMRPGQPFQRFTKAVLVEPFRDDWPVHKIEDPKRSFVYLNAPISVKKGESYKMEVYGAPRYAADPSALCFAATTVEGVIKLQDSQPSSEERKKSRSPAEAK